MMYSRSKIEGSPGADRRFRPARASIVGLVVAVGLVAGGLTSATAAGVATADRIVRMQASYVVIADGTVGVTETIEVDTGDQPRDGLVRSIPTVRKSPDGVYRALKIVQPSATRDGVAVPVQQVADEDYVVLVIGDSTAPKAGRHTFRLVYSLDGAIDTDSAGMRRTATVAANGDRMPAIERLDIALAGPVEAESCLPADRCHRSNPASPAGFVADNVPEGSAVTLTFGAELGTVAERNGTVVPDPTLDEPTQVVPGATSDQHEESGRSIWPFAIGLVAIVALVVGWTVRRNRATPQRNRK